MNSLLTGMLSNMGESGIEKLAASAGVNPEMAKKILAQAGPLLTSKMADNAKKEGGLASLDSALKDHDGSIFGKIDDVVNPDVDTKGSSILGHILGSNTGGMIEALAKGNNTDSGSTQKILEMAAPLILGQLGSQKKSGGMDAAGIFDLLQGEKKEVESSEDSMMMKLGKQFLDKDGDGSIVDDLMGMAKGFLK